MNILIEGLDLAGKSTTCRILRDHLTGDWEIRRNSLVRDNAVHNMADTMRKEDACSSTSLGFLYYSALRFDLDMYESEKQQTDVIQDSTIALRSLAYHTAMKTDSRLPELFAESLDEYPDFDAAFICLVSNETRQERLQLRRKRNLGPEDFLFATNPDAFRVMEDTLIRYATKRFNAVVLRTDGDLKHDTERIRQIVTEVKGYL